VVCRGVEYHAQSIVPLIEFPPAAVTDVSQSPYLQRLIRSDRVVARLCHGPIPTAGIDIAWTYSGFHWADASTVEDSPWRARTYGISAAKPIGGRRW
jgi:hypothetical protein